MPAGAARATRVHGDTPETRRLAEVAAGFWQRATEAGARVEAEGLTITNAKGTFRNPALQVEQQSRLGFLTAVRALRQKPKYEKVGRPSASDRYRHRLITGQERVRGAKARKYLTSA